MRYHSIPILLYEKHCFLGNYSLEGNRVTSNFVLSMISIEFFSVRVCLCKGKKERDLHELGDRHIITKITKKKNKQKYTRVIHIKISFAVAYTSYALNTHIELSKFSFCLL